MFSNYGLDSVDIAAPERNTIATINRELYSI